MYLYNLYNMYTCSVLVYMYIDFLLCYGLFVWLWYLRLTANGLLVDISDVLFFGACKHVINKTTENTMLN